MEILKTNQHPFYWKWSGPKCYGRSPFGINGLNIANIKRLCVFIFLTHCFLWASFQNSIATIFVLNSNLNRNMAFAPRKTKAAAYKTLVRPKHEYAAPVWMPHHHKEIDRTEKVQRTAAR